MTVKTNLKYSGMKLKALFAGILVACCFCIGLLVNSNANAESNTVATNETNEYSISDYVECYPSGVFDLLDWGNLSFNSGSGLSGITCPCGGGIDFQLYGDSGEWESGGLTFASGTSDWPSTCTGIGGRLKGMYAPYWMNVSGDDDWKDASICGYIGTEPYGKGCYIAGCFLENGKTFTQDVPFKVTLKYSSCVATSFTGAGTLILSGSDNLAVSGNPESYDFVYGDGTADNAYVKICENSTNSNDYILTVMDQKHFYGVDQYQREGAINVSNTYTATPTSGYGIKDVKFVSKHNSSELGIISPTNNNYKDTYYIDQPCNIITEFETPTTVTLDNEGTSITVNDVYNGLLLPNLTTEQIPTREGYVFAGYVDENGVKYYDKTGKSVIPWDKTGTTATLYASWTGASYTVTLDDGSGTTTEITATYGEEMPKLTTLPTKDKYVFEGYYDGKTEGTQYYKADGTSACPWDKKSDATLYAHWTLKKSIITLDLDGGTGKTLTIEVTPGSPMPDISKENLPTKDGYIFTGFYDSVGVQYYNADGTSAHVWDKSDNATLYAHWAKNADPTPTPTPDDGSAATDSSASASSQTGDSLAIYSILAACMGLAALGVFARNGYRKSENIRNRKH